MSLPFIGNFLILFQFTLFLTIQQVVLRTRISWLSSTNVLRTISSLSRTLSKVIALSLSFAHTTTIHQTLHAKRAFFRRWTTVSYSIVIHPQIADAENDSSVLLAFFSFRRCENIMMCPLREISSGSEHCPYDWVAVYDGRDDHAPLIGKFCGVGKFPFSIIGN